MSSPPIRLYTDENIDPAVAAALQVRGHDALSCHEAGNANQSLSDDWQIEWATSQGRAILTFNSRDFMLIAAYWDLQQREHCGILLTRPRPLSELIRQTHDFLTRFSSGDVRNITMWLP